MKTANPAQPAAAYVVVPVLQCPTLRYAFLERIIRRLMLHLHKSTALIHDRFDKWNASATEVRGCFRRVHAKIPVVICEEFQYARVRMIGSQSTSGLTLDTCESFGPYPKVSNLQTKTFPEYYSSGDTGSKQKRQVAARGNNRMLKMPGEGSVQMRGIGCHIDSKNVRSFLARIH